MVLYPNADELRQGAQQIPSFASNALQAHSQRMDGQHDVTPYLDHNQQGLLLAALNAQAHDRQKSTPQPGSGVNKRSTSDSTEPHYESTTMSGNDLFMSPQAAELDNLNGDYTPDLDYLDGDNSFDFDNADLGGEMIGALPGGEPEQHEKRKSPDEQDASDETDPKRQETQDGERGAKKPGRKPLTSEPTTKRKAQNRAAQRAFRERKEKHLKDLETKVTELTKSKEADKHENGMLKAQVERLQVELREYRKRLSLNGGSGSARSSPPLSAYTGQTRSNSGPQQSQNTFQFDFPKFGALPGSQIFGNSTNGAHQQGNTAPPVSQSPTANGATNGLPHGLATQQVQRQDSQESRSGRSMSPKTATPTGNGSNANTPPQTMDFPSVGFSTNSNMHGFAGTLPQMNDNPFGDLFSPSLLKSANFENGNQTYFGGNNGTTSRTNTLSQSNLSNFDPTNGGETGAGLNRVFQFNGGNSSASDSASPSCSSSSQWNANGPNSSCGTSPEPSHSNGSPANRAHSGSTDLYTNDKVNPLRQYSNANEIFGTNQPQQQQQQTGSMSNPSIGVTGNTLADFNVPASESFDPVLFGDYRDPTADAFGSTNDFSTAFFDDALNSTAPFDYGSPSNLFGILQSPQQAHNSLDVNNQPANAPTPSKNLMAEIERARDGGDDDYGLPGTQQTQQDAKKTDAKKLITCNNIWNQLQSNPEFQSGTFDLDSLCSELRAKARCSESGVVVSQDHVDTALKKLGRRGKGGGQEEMPNLLFERESWDRALKKLGGGGNGGGGQ